MQPGHGVGDSAGSSVDVAGNSAPTASNETNSPTGSRDYVAEPQASGYRAIHIYTKYHGRRIEVQVRAREQDSWAKIVEDLTSKTGVDFKNGDGPDEVHELLRELSEMLSRLEPGQLYTEAHTDALVDILTSLSMMAAFGLAVRSRHQGTGEE